MMGEMFTCPGMLVDSFPSPYPNAESARYASGGALPPGSSVYTVAKHEGLDYIFTLSLGYCDPPARIAICDSLYYNPCYPGGFVAVPPPLHSDSLVDYEDGMPCTKSNMARGFVNFLC